MPSWNKGETDLQDVGIKSKENSAVLDVTYAMALIVLCVSYKHTVSASKLVHTRDRSTGNIRPWKLL